MIIPNKFIKLDYNPSHDILTILWPDVNNYTLLELDHILNTVIDTLTYYHIKYLLVDARSSVVILDEALYNEIIVRFGRSLMKTPVTRVARVVANITVRQEQVQGVMEAHPLPITLQTFGTLHEASDWLLGKTVVR